MHEIRQDLTTGQWVIYSTERRDRPVDVHRRRAERTSLPSKDAHCPFCQTSEAASWQIVMEWPGTDPKLSRLSWEFDRRPGNVRPRLCDSLLAVNCIT